MNKYLVVYQWTHKIHNGTNLITVHDILNDYFFFKTFPVCSSILEKLIKKHNTSIGLIQLINIIQVQPEPADIQAKDVIDLSKNSSL